MSEQDRTRASLKRSRSPRASKQNDAPTTTPQCPNDDDKAAWRAYWREHGQYWRTEPEIGGERQKYLKERGNIKPDIENGIYPFKDVKLSRADIEWLLASHENGRGPVDWSDESQWGREGLDLRGAYLSQVDFTYLPLTRILGGLRGDEWPSATKKQCDMAAVHMQGAKFI